MSFKGKKTRRAVSLAASGVLLIALSACSGSSNNYGLLTDDVYAKSGDYTVTEKEMWDELKWSSKDVLTTQINNVITDKYIKNITAVMNTEFDKLSDDQKTSLDITNKDEFDKLHTQYSDRLVDYVIQDIYNFNFKNSTYEESIESLTKISKEKAEVSYVDEMYSNYRVQKIGDNELGDLIDIAEPYEHKDVYLSIANDKVLRQVYYSLYARELLAFDTKYEEVKKANDEDTDEDDDQYGYYTNANYIAAFKTKYTQTYDVNAILIRFTSEDEFNNTLRAFGVKIYNSKFYLVRDKEGENMSYQEYVEYYDDLSNSSLYGLPNVSEITDDGAKLELYVQLYNYMYGGYREKLSTGNFNYDVDSYNLNELRKLTDKINNDYDDEKLYDKAKKYLIENFGNDDRFEEDTRVVYTSKELEKLATAIKTLVYQTMADGNKQYSTATTSANDAQYFIFKLGNKLETSTNKDYEEFYAKDPTDYEILTKVKENSELKNDLQQYLINEDISDTTINSALSTALEDVKVKIYTEACEIAYSVANTNYSKAIGSNKDKNVLATIEYDDKTYNVNIKANASDESSVKIVGTDDAFGVYDYLENKDGATTAIDLLTKKIIKDTKAYEETNKDRDDYEKYLQVVLLNFANDGYSSSGYASTIGKYNFLMMYFHSADVEEIIDNYYRVQYASSKLLTNYASDELATFLMGYTNTAYENYFSIKATRLVVYFDGNEDNNADDIDKWKDKEVENWTKLDGTQGTVTFEYAAKQLVYEIYNKLSSSTTSHVDQLSSLIDEINNTAKFKYEENPILSENLWSKYRHLGLLVKSEEVTVTNSSVDVDFNIKSRLYDYARGHNDDDTKKYQYFINDTAPTEYIEQLTDEAVSVDKNDIVETLDGYNLLVATEGSTSPSAKYESDDDKIGLLTDIIVKYNDKYEKIENVYNDEDKLNINQIKLYVLDYVQDNSSTLSPSAIQSAIDTFLAPVVSRYTASETQRIILLSFIKNRAGIADNTQLYDVITYTAKGYNGEDGVLDTIIKINQRIADDYLDIYNDITGTSTIYPDWWKDISTIVGQFLLKEENK